jgi:hypothetical protein
MNPLHRFAALLVAAALLTPVSATSAPLFTRATAGAGRAPTTLAARPESRATLLEVSAEGLAEFRAQGGGRMAVPAPDADLVLVLEPFDAVRPEAITITDERGTRPAGVDVSLYRGTVEGEDGSWAVVTLSPEGATAVIQRPGGRLLLAPTRDRVPGGLALHAIADESAVLPETREWACGTDDARTDLAPGGLPPRAPERTNVQATTQRLVLDVAVDCDWEIYSSKFGGNLANATNYMVAVLATVSLIYERDLNTRLAYPYLNFWTTAADPYGAANTSAQLSEFQNWWNANRSGVSRATAHLVSGRSLGGGIAYLNQLCGSAAYGVSAIDAAYSYPTNTTTWDVEVIAHELGHNFGSPHTHSCYWQSAHYVPTGALLDSCYTTEGSCNSAPRGLPPDKGTIMSYCHLIAGTAGGIRLDFHPHCITVIRAGAENAICRTAPFPQPPRALTFTPTSAGGTLSWTPGTTVGVIRYDIFRSSFQLDPGAALRGSSTTTAWADTGFGTFYYRVRAVRAADSTDWSGETRGTLCAPGAATQFTAATTPLAAARGDFDEDGIQDLVVTSQGAAGVVVLRGNGSGGVGDGTFGAPVTYATGSAPLAAAVGDWNADGITDLAVANSGTGSVSLLPGNGTAGAGDGTFGAATSMGVSGEPSGIATGDFDEDGIADLAVACASAGTTLMLGNGSGGVGDGTFTAHPPIATGTASAIVVDDFDDNGIWDLAVTTPSGARVLLGNGAGGRGDGTFAAFVNYPCQSSPQSIATGDWNADGITDLAVGNVGSASVSVLLGNGTGGVGDGTFAAAAHYSAGGSPYGVSVADWNADGVTDLTVANNTSVRTFSVLTGVTVAGAPTGAFAPAQAVPTPGQPRNLLLGDFDEDGAVDALAVQLAAGNVARIPGGCGAGLSGALAVLAPNGGETWVDGEERTIAWTRGAGVQSVDVQVSRDGGASWQTIAEHQHGTSFIWTVTPPHTADVRVRVVDALFAQRSDDSDGSFTVAAFGVGAPPQRAALALSGAWPNPARGTLGVSFTLPDGSPAALELLDLAGRRVALRDVGALGAGSHRVTLVERERLRPGLYMVRLTRGAESRTMKVAFVR